MEKSAVVTGITGQTGSYIAELLLSEGYKVYGLIRRSSNFNTQRINHIYSDLHINKQLELVYGDLSDSASIEQLVRKTQPDLFFNMGAMSHVRVSFDIPVNTFDLTGTSVMRCLEALKEFSPHTHFVTASSSVSGNTPVLIKENGHIKLRPIEQLVENNFEKTYHDNLECLTVDDNYNVKWAKVAYAFQHNADNLYQVKGSGGLDITITGNHSAIILDNECNLIEKRIDELSKDDFFVSFTNSSLLKNEYPEFDLSEFANTKKNPRSTEIHNLKLNADLMRFIGFYVAEGGMYIENGKQYHTTLTFHIKEDYYTNDIRKILKNNLNFEFPLDELRLDKNTRKININNKQLAYFLEREFGNGAHNKKIPAWMFNLPKEGILEFLRGYIGDAKIDNNEIRYTSCSQSLIESICYLAKMAGIDCCLVKRFNHEHLSPQGTMIKDAWAYDLIFRGKNCDLIAGKEVNRTKNKNLNQNLIDANIFRKLVKGSLRNISGSKKTISKKRILNLLNKFPELNENLTKLKKLCESDLHIVRIKEIKKLDVEMKVYDLHVPETQRFIGGNYPVLLHNSEMFGSTAPPQNEQTLMHPRSPYAVAKLAGYWATINYREAYNMFASNLIMFNTESPRRGETFVTRKITRAATRIHLGLQKKLYLGNLDARRDFIHAKDSAKAAYLVATHSKASDFVVGSGQSVSIAEFAEKVFNKLGMDYKNYIEFDSKYLRPTEVDHLQCDPTKIKNELGWSAKYDLDMLIDEMVKSDLELAQKELKYG